MRPLLTMAQEPLFTVSGRIRTATVERLDRIVAVLDERRPGEIVKRSDALRAAIERGVEVLERELGIEPNTEAPSPSKGAKRGRATLKK